MRPRLKISRAGIELIESFEGLRRTAARLPDGRWTIGYGHTLSAREGAEVSAEDAEALLLFDLLPVVEAVNGVVFTELTQNQFDALCAFAFNVGIEAFRGSDVLKRVNDGRLTEAACAFDLWRKADIAGEEMVLDALIRRRAAEKALFLTPADGFVPTPTPLVRPTPDQALAPALPQRRPAEIEAPLEGAEAVVRRVGPIEAAEPEAAAEPVAPEAEDTPAEQEIAAVELAEPGADALTAEPAAPAAPAAEEVTVGAETDELAARAAEPGAEAIAAVEEAAAPEPVPAEPSPQAAEPAAPAAAANLAAAAAMSARLFSPYGGGAGFGALPPRPRLTEVAGVPMAPVAEVPQPPLQAAAPAPEVAATVEPAPAAAVSSNFEPPARPEPAGSLETGQGLTPQPFTLTPPPEREPTFMAQPASVVWGQPAAAEPAEAGAPLFEETWEEVRPAPRIIRHEPVETDLLDEEAGPTTPFVLLGVIGLFAFGGAVAAFLKAKQVATPEPVILAWVLAVIAVACVSTSVYFLLKRLGGVHD